MSIISAIALAAATLSATTCGDQINLVDQSGQPAATIALSCGSAGVHWPHSDATVLLKGATADVSAGKVFAPLTFTLVLTYDRARCADGKGWSGEPSTGITATFYCRPWANEKTRFARQFPDGAYEVYGVEPNSKQQHPTYSLIFDKQDGFLGFAFARKASRINGKRPKAWKVDGSAVAVTRIAEALTGVCN